MRLIKIAFIFFFFITGIYLLACIFIPEKYKIERSVVIDAPPDFVYRHIENFKHWKDWEPWSGKDSNLRSLYSPDDALIEPYWVWQSKIFGDGKFISTGSVPLKEFRFTFNFSKPYEAETKGSISIVPEENRSRVKWYIEGGNPFYLRPFNLIMDSKIGPFFEAGLEQLARVSEKDAEIFKREYFSYRILADTFKGGKFITDRKSILFEEVDEYFKNSLKEMKIEARNCEFKIIGSPICLFHFSDYINNVENREIAIPVEGDSIIGPDYTTRVLKPKKALVLNYFGGYKSSQKAYKALDNYIRNNGLRLKKPVIEEYIVGPGQERDSGLWHTKIYYPLE